MAATSRLPAGPTLPRYVQSYLYLQQREWFMPRLLRKFGDGFSLHVPPYADDLVVFAGREPIKQIFQADPALLHAGEGNQILGFVMGEHSVLLVDEAEHTRIRGLLMPAFNGAALSGYRTMIGEIAEREVRSWSTSQDLPTLHRMNRLTLDIIIAVVFGVTDPKVHSELVSRLAAIIDLNPIVFLGCKCPALQRFPPWRGFRDNQNRIDAILYREIDARRGAQDLHERTDVLSRLLQHNDPEHGQLTDPELRDQLISLLLAGHETTAAALTWTLWEIAQSPTIQAEAARAAAGDDDKYLEALLKEGMRLHTVIVSTARRATADTTIDGTDIPAGSVVNTSILLAHQDPDNFPDPLRFDPGRFLGRSPPILGSPSAAECGDASARDSPSPRASSSCAPCSGTGPSLPQPAQKTVKSATSPPYPPAARICALNRAAPPRR
ncbi:cytochrome P450 [Tsukamurella ocularis]|nr:cytochrome P450 [Tsukamurella ocularis]